jgi:predicted DNA-binding WGR domain protein
MTTALPSDVDVELRLIDPSRNAFRLYGLTACRTLFDEPCLRIQWGRIGNRRVRERSETFKDGEALEHRWAELLARRRQHGYRLLSEAAVVVPSEPRRRRSLRSDRLPLTPPPCPPAPLTKVRAVERDIVEAHGLPLGERAVQQLVVRWHEATAALARYLEERRAEHLDLVDVSTLAAMYVDALAS